MASPCIPFHLDLLSTQCQTRIKIADPRVRIKRPGNDKMQRRRGRWEPPSLLLRLTMWRPNLGVFSLSPFFFSWVLSRGLIYELHAGRRVVFFPSLCLKSVWGGERREIQTSRGERRRDSIDWPCLLDNAYICSWAFFFFVKGTIFRWWEQDACF